MPEHEAGVAQLLDDVLPRGDIPGDWERVLRDAEARDTSPTRRRLSISGGRLAVILTILALAAVAPLVAFGAADDWWFFGHANRGPAPSGNVVVVQSGSWNGIPWALTAYRPQAQGICVGLTPNPPSGRPAAGPSGIGGSSVSTAGLVCSAGLHGMGAPPTGAPSHWLSFIGSDGAGEPVSGFPGFAAGAAAEGVATVEVILASGSSLLAETVPAPTELGQSVRFYVIRVPDGDSVTSLVAQDAQGETLEELTVPQASHAATAGP